MIRPVVTASIVGFTLATLASPAWAPQMVAEEIATQRSLGYSICEPIIAQLPDEEEVNGMVAAAIPTPYGGECRVWFGNDLTMKDLPWVAWHEVCHLATINPIFADPDSSLLADPAHHHPMFRACIAQGPTETGGY